MGAGPPDFLPGPNRADEVFKPTPFSMWASDVVRICLARKASDVGDPKRQFQPLFTHQVFGFKEEIVGFENPAVQIVYAADSLRPCICFTASDKVERGQLQALGLRRTDVLDCIRKHAPSDYAASTKELLDDACEPQGFQPMGQVIWRYPSQHSGGSDAVSQMAGERAGGGGGGQEGGDEGSVNEFRVYQTELKTKGELVLLQRVQSLAMWLIERASYIKADSHWQLLMLYEHHGKVRARPAHSGGNDLDGDEDMDMEMDKDDTREGTCFVGFVTLYKDYKTLKHAKSRRSRSRPVTASRAGSSSMSLPSSAAMDHGRSEEELEDGNRDGGREEAGGGGDGGDGANGEEGAKFRLRISQFVILPPYQRRGHGEQLLRAVYKLGRGMKHCTEVCVENPSPGFSKLRDKTDARVLQELGFFEHLQADSPEWDELTATLKWSRTQLRHLHSSVVRRVVRSLQAQRQDGTFAGTDSSGLLGACGSMDDSGALCEVEGTAYFAGNFVVVRGPEGKQLLAQLLGINPATKLLRVRWLYRWRDLPEGVIASSSRRWRRLLLSSRGARRKVSAEQETETSKLRQILYMYI